MSAPSPQTVIAVGGSFREGDGAQSLIERWDGSAWRTSIPAVPGATAHSVLSGITTDSAGNFCAVGSYRNAASSLQTLTMRCP